MTTEIYTQASSTKFNDIANPFDDMAFKTKNNKEINGKFRLY
jgi:hypothetical protein